MNTDFHLSKKACISCGSNEFVGFYKATKRAPISNTEVLSFDQSLECCNECGLIRQEENTSYARANLDKYYSLTFRTPIEPGKLLKTDKRVKNAQKRLKFILGLKRSGSLLEVGFGDGVFLSLAAGKFTCTGLDPSAGYKYVHDYLHQKGAEVSDISLEKFRPAGKFDVICSFLVLEHIKDPLAFVRLQLAHLKRDGILVIEVPDVRRYGIFDSESVLTYEHVYHYCIESLQFLLSKAGLELVSYSNKDVSYGFSLIAAFRQKKARKTIPMINGFGVLKIVQPFIEKRLQYQSQMTGCLSSILKNAREKGQRVAIYGTGFLFNYAVDCCALELDNIDLVLDDTKDKSGKILFGKTIEPLAVLRDRKADLIIVFSEMFFGVMRQNILNMTGGEEVQIIDIHHHSIQKND